MKICHRVYINRSETELSVATRQETRATAILTAEIVAWLSQLAEFQVPPIQMYKYIKQDANSWGR